MRLLRITPFLLLGLLTLAIPIVAQGTCPALVQEAFTATELICTGTSGNQTCLGNGVVEAQAKAGVTDFILSTPGDLATTTDIDSLRLRSLNTANSIWSVVQLQIPLESENGTEIDVTAMMFGDLALTNQGEESVTGNVPILNGTVQAINGINVRRTPEAGGVVVWPLLFEDNVFVTGRTADNRWLRIEIPSAFGGSGWVTATFMELDGDIITLAPVTATSLDPVITVSEFGSMQAITFQSSVSDPTCAGTPDSGIVLQTPAGLAGNVSIQVNGVNIDFNGTIFLRAQVAGALTISTLEGQALAEAQQVTEVVTAGTEVAIPIDNDLNVLGTPQDPALINVVELSDLPTRILPRPVIVGEFNTVVGANVPSTDVVVNPPPVQQPPAQPTPIPQPTVNTGPPVNTGPRLSPETPTPAPVTTGPCTLTAVGENKNMRGGPGIQYDVVEVLFADRSVVATGKNADQYNYRWYKTERGGWVRFDVVEETGDCNGLPTSDAPPPPTPVIPPTSIVPTAAPGSVDFSIVDWSFTANPLICNTPVTITMLVANTGPTVSPGGTVRVQDEFNGASQGTAEATFGAIQPNQSVQVSIEITIATFYNESHKLTATVDPNNAVAEVNEGNNARVLDYVLQKGGCP